MSRPAPSAVVFDLFGVIACAQSTTGRDRLLAAAGVQAEEFWQAYWDLRPSYDAGGVSGPAYWRAVAAELDTDFEPWRIAQLIDADCESWAAVDPEMVDLVERLAGTRLPIGLLSNIPAELAAEFEQQHPWLDRFSVTGFSCRIGHAKPDPAAFWWCVRALGLGPSAVLFVDDREENVRAAEDVGLRGHVFTGIDGLLEILDGHGVLEFSRG
jgi:putative hydrolase of the HAD superfamily